MSDREGGIIVSRLLVVISVVLVPIIIFLIFIIGNFHLWFTIWIPVDAEMEFLILKVLCPLVFSVSWLFFLILFATRLANTLDSMDKTISIVPLRLKLFFGINALFIMFIFVIPLVTPLIAVVSFMAMAWRITTFRKKDWEGEKAGVLTKIMEGIFALPPLFCTVVILPEVITLSVFLFTEIWIPLLDIIFIISLCLCTALAFGSFIILIQHSGVSEYEQLFAAPSEEKSKTSVRFLQLALFAFFLFLAFYGFTVIELFYNMGFILVLIVTTINYLRGKRQDKAFKGHLLGYLLAAVFMGSNLLFFSFTFSAFSELLRVGSLVISASLFIVVFFYVFITYEETPL
ncbi:MAG: hypothetical protein ACTSR8_15490 [Promethearchaeota archaeon]